jgi:plastocyanin
MSSHKARTVGVLIAVALLSAATIAAIVPRTASSSGPVHEIRLVVRDMSYYVEGSAAPNPTLTVQRGERVRVTLRNEDDGMAHDFAVRAWNAGTPRLSGGAEAVIQFQAPEQPGVATYSCTPHGEMMRGTITVE